MFSSKSRKILIVDWPEPRERARLKKLRPPIIGQSGPSPNKLLTCGWCCNVDDYRSQCLTL